MRFFSDEQLFEFDTSLPWYANIVNFLTCNVLSLDLNSQQRKKFCHDVKCYQWDDPLLFRRCVDQMIGRCVPEVEYGVIIDHCHFSPYGDNFGALRKYRKVLEFGFY